VSSADYSTFAVLSKLYFKELSHDVPEFESELRNYVYTMYNDDKVKLWAFETLK
jgi:hypothetical protein